MVLEKEAMAISLMIVFTDAFLYSNGRLKAIGTDVFLSWILVIAYRKGKVMVENMVERCGETQCMDLGKESKGKRVKQLLEQMLRHSI